LIAELVKRTSVGSFWRNSTLYRGSVKVLDVAAPTEVEILIVISPPVLLQSLTQVAELRLVAVPAVVGVEISVSMSLVICIIKKLSLLSIYNFTKSPIISLIIQSGCGTYSTYFEI
jgi:hypothetical protein